MARSKHKDFGHIGPGTLAGRYMRLFWQPIYCSDELVKGRPARVQVLGEHFTLYRGESGKVQMLDDRCPHRQTSLAYGSVSGDNILCFYHGWEFNGAGQCVRQPAGTPGHAAKIRIRSYPVREYMGLVFCYLGDGEAPAFYRFPELEDVRDADISVHRHEVPCSYFQRVENDLDEVHVHFVHARSTNRAGLDEIPEINVRETEYGIRREGKRHGVGANISRIAHFMMPNINLVDLPPSPGYPYWTVHAAWRVPLDDETSMTHSIRLKRREDGAGSPRAGKERKTKTASMNANVMPADKATEAILAGKMRVEDLDRDYPYLFVVEDNVALAGQGRLTDRSKDHLSISDKGVILLRKIWERELKALDEGKPLKQWRRPQGRLELAVSAIKEAQF